MSDTTAYTWLVPEQRILLPKDEVHVWRVMLDQPKERTQHLYSVLAPEEKERAARFHFQKDRDHFVAAHGMVRTILATYLGLQPRDLHFSRASYGKPYLSENTRAGLRFNLSHSNALALVAVSREREIGVDVEWIRRDVAEEKIAERFFSLREVATLRSLPPEQQPEAFFNCWTRKEAYIKARGEGLSLPLDTFDVSLAPGEPAALLENRIDAGEMSRWRLVELAPGAGFKAALVVEGQDCQLRCWQWLW